MIWEQEDLQQFGIMSREELEKEISRRDHEADKRHLLDTVIHFEGVCGENRSFPSWDEEGNWKYSVGAACHSETRVFVGTFGSLVQHILSNFWRGCWCQIVEKIEEPDGGWERSETHNIVFENRKEK